MYGWAGGQLGLPDSPQLIDMLDVAGGLAMKLEYRLACFGVHASARSLSQPLHHWDPTLQVPGVHTVDLAQPGADTAHTLVAMTTLLIREPWDIDKLAYVHALARVRDVVEIDLHRTTRRIELEAAREEERALRRGGRQMFMTRRGRDGGRRTTGRA